MLVELLLLRLQCVLLLHGLLVLQFVLDQRGLLALLQPEPLLDCQGPELG